MVCPICDAESGCPHIRRSEGSATIPTRSYREERNGIIIAENAMIGEGQGSRDAFFYKDDLESARTDQAGVVWLTLKPNATFFIPVR
jgi:hypothetical protein